MRKRQLLGFMKNVGVHAYLYTAAEYQTFLKGTGDYAKLAASLKPPTSRRIIGRFEKYFGKPDINDEDSFDLRIKQYEKDFKEQLIAMREMKHKTKALSESYAQFKANLAAFSEGVQLIEPTIRNEEGEMEPWFEALTRIKDDNPYLCLHIWFVMEKQECTAICGAIKGRNDILTRRKMAIQEKERCEQKFKKLCAGKMMLPWQSRNKQKVKYEERIDTVRGNAAGR